jgi:hypothetical protein
LSSEDVRATCAVLVPDGRAVTKTSSQPSRVERAKSTITASRSIAAAPTQAVAAQVASADTAGGAPTSSMGAGSRGSVG